MYHILKCAKSTIGVTWCHFCKDEQLQTHNSGCYHRLKAVEAILSASDIQAAIETARKDRTKWKYLKTDVRYCHL